MQASYKRLRLAIIAALIMSLAAVSVAGAQTATSGYETNFTSSITYQNLSDQPAADPGLTFRFFSTMSASPEVRNVALPANAGGSLFLGGPQANLPTGFSGSATMSADVPLAAVTVQVPQNSEVRNRPLSTGFTAGQASNRVLLATVLKNQFGQTSKFSVQNADSDLVNINVAIFNADNPSAAPINLPVENIPPGAATAFDMREIAQIASPSFNGSAIVTAQRASDGAPANIVATATELGTPESADNRLIAVAFEGVNEGGREIYMATALCDIFGGQNTAYAIQNVDPDNAAQITVNFQGVGPGNAPMSGSTNVTVNPGAKASVLACNASGIGPGFNGAATINVTSAAGEIVVIGKLYGSRNTAFLGELTGGSRLSLPYVRWSPDDEFLNNQSYQRGFIAIQNIGSSPATNVQVRYRNVEGALVGTHTIDVIPPTEKRNSRAIDVSACTTPGQTTSCPTEIQYFGNPQGNPDARFGGAVEIVGPSGSELIAIVRIETGANGPTVAEDYNAIQVVD